MLTRWPIPERRRRRRDGSPWSRRRGCEFFTSTGCHVHLVAQRHGRSHARTGEARLGADRRLSSRSRTPRFRRRSCTRSRLWGRCERRRRARRALQIQPTSMNTSAPASTEPRTSIRAGMGRAARRLPSACAVRRCAMRSTGQPRRAVDRPAPRRGPPVPDGRDGHARRNRLRDHVGEVELALRVAESDASHVSSCGVGATRMPVSISSIARSAAVAPSPRRCARRCRRHHRRCADSQTGRPGAP